MTVDPTNTIILSATLSGIVGWIVAGQRLKWEFRLEMNTARAIHALLNEENWKLRSFGEISKRIGGFRGDDLRQLLVAAGAVRFQKSGNPDILDTDDEMWGLIEKNNV